MQLCRLLRRFILTYFRRRRRLASADISWYSTGHGHIEQTAGSNRNTDKNWELTPMILNCRYHVHGIIV